MEYFRRVENNLDEYVVTIILFRVHTFAACCQEVGFYYTASRSSALQIVQVNTRLL